MTFVVDGTVAALVAIIIQVLLKPLLEIWLKPDAPNHDTAVRALALVLGVLLLALDTLVGGPWPVTGNAWLLLVGSGALSGISAVGAYHIFSGSATPTVLQSAIIGPEPEPVRPSVPEHLTFSPSPLHQAAGIAGTWQFPPASNADATAPAAVPPTLTEAANAGRQGMPASLLPESERTATVPPAGVPAPSPSPEPAAPAATPA